MRKAVIRTLLCCIVGSFLPLSATLFTFAWFLGATAKANDDQAIDGAIGLREYFYHDDDYIGDGSHERPFEIALPAHFYNLTRLQNLGAFAEGTEFRLGHVFYEDGHYGEDGYALYGGRPRCIELDEHGDPTYVNHLDLTDYCQDNPLLPIGSEGAPFYGIFDGRDVPIVGLKVASTPEDIGVFGYVAHTATVKNLVCDGLEIISNGYNAASTEEDKTHDLFVQNLDNIFTSADWLATASVAYYDKTGTTHTLKTNSGATTLNNINATANFLPGGYVVDGYFLAALPTPPEGVQDPFKYSFKSSASVMIEDKMSIEGKERQIMRIDLKNLRASSDFRTKNIYISTRLSLVATTEVEGYSFSRVIQSYECTFYSNDQPWNEGAASCIIKCDYAGGETGYHHGNNIGFIAGHVDGSVVDCYVFDGKFTFNHGGNSLTPVVTESDTGLIGEIGSAVSSSLSPHVGPAEEERDTGTMNFSRIYNMIRRDFDPDKDDMISGFNYQSDGTTGKSYIAYAKKIDSEGADYEMCAADAETFDRYKQYLRYVEGDPEYYITGGGSRKTVGQGTETGDFETSWNSVDFLWNNLIQDEDEVDRGLGVFKLATAYNGFAKEGAYGSYYLDNLGDSCIHNGSPIDKVYFSTAECDWTKEDDYPGWGDPSVGIIRPTTLPSYSEPKTKTSLGTFSYPFSRDFNYCFELDLAATNKPDYNNYMYDTDCKFLENYLSSILIDSDGDPVEHTDPNFGLMLRNDKEQKKAVDSFSSYIEVGNPGSTKALTNDGKYYPPNSIIFHISNPTGANVSVVGCQKDISIYSFNSSVEDQTPTELYTMRSRPDNLDYGHRFFTYQYGDETDEHGNEIKSGTTGTKAEIRTNSEMRENGSALYAHIFRIDEPGDYVIGSSRKTATNAKARVYFVCAQGQEDAEMGPPKIATLGNTIEDVDFLLSNPLGTNPASPNDPIVIQEAEFQFKAEFNLQTGEFTVGIQIYLENPYINLIFNRVDPDDESKYSTVYLKATCKKRPDPRCYFNGVSQTLDGNGEAEYPSS